jgi:penicillin-insensitive murein DD-endopeptidase
LTGRRPRSGRTALFAGLALALVGCFASPTPLAPGLRGSVGVPHHGVQTDAVELPRQGTGFARYRPFGASYWGSPRLVQAVVRAAAAVERQMPGGAPLILGDLSSPMGGRIPRHNSHRTGRDIDLLWYVTTPSGTPVRNPGFIQVLEDGLAHVPEGNRYLLLDVPRQWLLLRELLTDPDIEVQWLFCSAPVEALLIEYARARQEPAELVWHAETVLLQPGDSLAHDDHIHMRIACRPDEMVAGCQGGGPHWEWLPPIPRLTETDDWLYEVAAADPFAPDVPPEPVARAHAGPEAERPD